MQQPPNPYSQINDKETFAERQARVRAQTQKDEEAVARAEAYRQARAKANAERQAQARADFDALGKEMAKATTRAERVELGRKRADLAPYTGFHHDYESHCWNCKMHISSAIHAQCPDCTYYICSNCNSCLCGF